MSLFGGFGTNNAGAAGAAPAAGQPAQQQQPNIFGQIGSNNSTGGGAQPLQSQATQPASAFGTPAAPANANAGSTGSLFGGTIGGGTTATSGLFGQTNPTNNNATPSLFGQQQTQPPANQTGATGGLFGNAPQQPAAPTGGLFGTTTQQAPANNAGTTGTGLFGNTTTQTAPASQGTGLFGQSQAPAAGGLFGSSTTGAGTGLFGAAKPATGFGASTTTNGGGLFGQQTQQTQAQQQNPFGQSTANAPAGNSMFGNSTLGMSALGKPGTSTLRTALSNNQMSSNDPMVQFVQLTEKIEGVYNAWNPTSPHCRFQYPFYNLVDPNQVALYNRPANVLNDSVWEKAVRENPDPSCFVPVVAIGFDDIRERVEAQSKTSTEQQQKLADLKTRLADLAMKHSVSNVARLQKASVGMTQIVHRLLRLIQHLHLLIPAVRSSAIRPEEEALRGRLEEIEDELRKGRVGAKVNELWALIGAVSAVVERGRGAGGEWAVVDEDGMAQIVRVLKDQQTGLAHLTKVLQKDKADMAVIMGQSVPAAGDNGAGEDEMLWNSTATLRASALR